MQVAQKKKKEIETCDENSSYMLRKGGIYGSIHMISVTLPKLIVKGIPRYFLNKRYRGMTCRI